VKLQSEYERIIRTHNGCAFTETNIAMYDKQVIVHTLDFTRDRFQYPTKLRVTWKDDDMKALDPSVLFNGAAHVHVFTKK
jgi:hypothetical protein